MSRWKRVLAVVVAGTCVVLAAGISLTIGWRPILGPKLRATTDRKFEVTEARLARGKYIAEHVSGCKDCHSAVDWSDPKLPKFVAGKEYAGQNMTTPGFPGTVVAYNLTSDKETGLGNWSDDEIARAIREGVDKNGHTLFPLMPYTSFREMSDEDLASVVVFLRSLPAVKNPLPQTAVKFPLNRLVNAAPEPVTQPVVAVLSTSENRGKYLVKIGACQDCHTPRGSMGAPVAGMEYAGGQVETGPWGTVASANITPDETGIAYYTQDMFVQTMRTGKVGGVRPLNPFMPWQMLSGQTDQDLGDMYTYLRTVKPAKHFVNSVDSPTLCVKCGQKHGLGAQNEALQNNHPR